MPTATSEGVDLYYETTGTGETVAFVGEAGYGGWQWSWGYGAVAGPYRALTLDLRGTGRSDAPAGPYDVDTLAADLEAVLSAADARRAHLVGAGLGGMVALRYARTFDRARTLALFSTAAEGSRIDESALRALHAPPEDREALRESLSGAFSPSFLAAEDHLEQILEWRADGDASEAGFEAQLGAALAFEAGPLYEVGLPALVCHGLADPVVPVAAGRALAEALPRGTFEPVEGRHLCFAEHSRAVTDRLRGLLDETTG